MSNLREMKCIEALYIPVQNIHCMIFCYTELEILKIYLEILSIPIFYVEIEEFLNGGSIVTKYLFRKDEEYENTANERVF